MTIKNALKQIIPPSIWNGARQAIRDFVFNRALTQFLQLPNNAPVPEKILSDLVYGWGNEGWSAHNEYLVACLDYARRADGAILECGSGLSTILLGAIATQKNSRVWSQEHNAEWAKRVSGILRQHKIAAVELCVADLKSYGDFSWYDPPKNRMSPDISLVVCDGPPYDTPGGRYGVLPVMREYLKPGCVILLDDIERAEELAIIQRWARDLGTDYKIQGAHKPFGVLVVK